MLWEQYDKYYNELKDILPRGGVSSYYFEGIHPRFIRRFIGSYMCTNKTSPILSELFHECEAFAAQDDNNKHGTLEFFRTKNHSINGMRLTCDDTRLTFSRLLGKEDNVYKNKICIEGHIFTEIGLFQCYGGTMFFYEIEDLIRYAEEKKESLYYIKKSGLPTKIDIPHVEINADFELLFDTVCSIREGNLDVLNKFSEFSNRKTEILGQVSVR